MCTRELKGQEAKIYKDKAEKAIAHIDEYYKTHDFDINEVLNVMMLHFFLAVKGQAKDKKQASEIFCNSTRKDIFDAYWRSTTNMGNK